MVYLDKICVAACPERDNAMNVSFHLNPFTVFWSCRVPFRESRLALFVLEEEKSYHAVTCELSRRNCLRPFKKKTEELKLLLFGLLFQFAAIVDTL